MGENMRVWRSKGSHAALRLVVVGVMLLTLAQSGSVPPQTVCGGLPHQNVTQPEYVALRATNGSGDVMADLVGPFLNVVQPKPFPRGQYQVSLQRSLLCALSKFVKTDVGQCPANKSHNDFF